MVTLPSEPFQAAFAGDRHKVPQLHTFRYLTLAEHKALQAGEHVLFLGTDGKVGQFKINGQPKVWKTRPNDVQVPLKYGLRLYTNAVFKDGQRADFSEVLIKEVENAA